ncbi:hypothetical protein H0H81_006159 [Sphagnurus paluster]|uniref:Uncharacterized protein n=1 Tax=Sphagnurus paluster TaxID=117069 RepID=A0A9P7KKX5_9AGAR|nr:hypothetical protein H0H81_006159 [Sphagnurus paluster]
MLMWDEDTKNIQRSLFKDTLVQAFNTIYGTDENDLASWQNLCSILHIAPMPEGLTACREAVAETNVNLVDLVDLPNSNNPVTTFPTEVALSEYTLGSGKIFPRENAYAGGLLKYLLRHIMNPRTPRAKPRVRTRRRGRR